MNCRGLLDGRYHLEEEYDIVVVDMDGAQGMEYVCKYRELYGSTLVVWITDDRYFAGVAVRTHTFGFIVRPFEEPQLRETVRRIREGDIAPWQRGTVKLPAYLGGPFCEENIQERRSGTIWEKIKKYLHSENSL